MRKFSKSRQKVDLKFDIKVDRSHGGPNKKATNLAMAMNARSTLRPVLALVSRNATPYS